MKDIRGIKKRYLIGGIILVAVVGYLLYMSLGSSVMYYVTVGELLNGGYGAYDTDIRVTGRIASGSIEWNAEELELEFDVIEGNATLPVIYNGAIPDGFTSGADVLVEGRYHPDEVFRASAILMKCPSKYEPEE
jgi:cytochrome c-type biogenesis protein CcmE